MSRSNVETRWMKFGNIKDFIVLSNDVIAIASGIHVMFLNLTTREERIEKFDSPERGSGASCLAGHPLVPMFATAERRSRPKIFIFTYPGIRLVSKCILEDSANGFLSCVFAGSEYLLTLTSFPDFRIVTWSWRNGENLTSIETTISDHHQRIVCSSSSPYQLSQLGEISGNLAVYEINVCSRIIMISSTNGNLSTSTSNKIVCTSWSSDGNLFQCDVNGNVTMNCNDGKKCRIIVHGEDCERLNFKGNPLIVTFRSGIIVVNRESQISFYRKPTTIDSRIKSATPWKQIWSIEANSHPVHIAKSSQRENLLFCTDGGEIFELINPNDDEDKPRIRLITQQGLMYKFLTPVNPRIDQLVAIDELDALSILQSLTGQLVSRLCLRIYGSVRCIVSHPNLPLVAIGTDVGKFLLINLSRVSQPFVARVIHLERKSIEKIRYSWSNTLLGVANTDRAKLFVITSGTNESYFVLSSMNLTLEIIDFLLHEYDNESTKILILAKTNKSREIGKKIIIYSLDNSNCNEKCLFVIELSNFLDSLSYGRTRLEIIVVPYLTKQLHFLQIQDDYKGITLSEAMGSGHQLRNIRHFMNDSYFVTCSYDGLIIGRCKTNVRQVLTIFMSHHRLDGGAKNAILSSCNGMIVSLGRNGDLVATKICNLKSVENVPELDDLDMSILQSNNVAEDDLTWIERKVEMNLQAEREQCAGERNSILDDFSKLRERLKILLDANEHETTNLQLSISDFDLDQESRERKIHENITHQICLREKLKSQIFQRDEVSKYLRKLCWDSMEIQACSVLSINGKTKIDNFPLPRVRKDVELGRKWENFIVELESRDKSIENNRMNVIDESPSLLGTTSHRFINEELNRSINQVRKCPSYIEGLRSCIVIRDRERKLKIYFNKMFEDMRTVKDRELMIVAERLEEIKHCTLELKTMFNTSTRIRDDDDTLSQPLWHYSEKPETIVTITDNEISKGCAARYLERDNHREIMEKREEEGSRLNDSFREEALEIMMDGLLEVRWEDEIKKDPPRPLFLTTKDPSTFTHEEVAEFEIYRIKCEELERERRRYEKMLNDKILRVKDALKRDVECFDRKVENFCLNRMKLESAILQETLMRLRESQRHQLRLRGITMIQLASDELTLAIEDFRKLSDTLTILEITVNETRNRYENLLKRDKILDGKFRDEFPDLKQPMVEHLLRHYRKRPRNVQLTCTSITYLTEVVRCIVNCEKSDILPRDCVDFLRGMDSLDTMPNNLPIHIDTSHWTLLCKLRRGKIELDIKMKICAVDLAEAEQTFASHQKSCSYTENKVSQLREILKEREIVNLEQLENSQVQLVLKMGQIESELYGNPEELCNAVLVPLSIVVSANDAIIQAGRKKLNAMNKTIVFRRTTLWREWRHECMRIKLDNMREELKVLQGVKVSREIQNYLLTESGDIGTEKKAKSCDLVVASTKKRFGKILMEKIRQYDDRKRGIKSWRMKNKKNNDTMETMKLANFNVSTLMQNEKRERDASYRVTKIRAIMKRTRLKKKIEENYGELLALQTQLELLRLKTYPTLRIKGLTRDKGTKNKRRAD